MIGIEYPSCLWKNAISKSFDTQLSQNRVIGWKRGFQGMEQDAEPKTRAALSPWRYVAGLCYGVFDGALVFLVVFKVVDWRVGAGWTRAMPPGEAALGIATILSAVILPLDLYFQHKAIIPILATKKAAVCSVFLAILTAWLAAAYALGRLAAWG